MLGAKTLFVDERSSTLVMRDTPERVRMAEKLVASLDVPEPEVIMEVEVLEIAHSLAEQLGINYPTNVAFSATKPPNSTAAGIPGLVLSDLGKQSANTIAVSNARDQRRPLEDGRRSATCWRARGSGRATRRRPRSWSATACRS